MQIVLLKAWRAYPSNAAGMTARTDMHRASAAAISRTGVSLSGNERHASVLGCADIKGHGLGAAGTRCRPFDQTVCKVGHAFTKDSRGTHYLISTLHQKLFGSQNGFQR
jgi:hypothetical protein